MSDWIEEIGTAWNGHRVFAEWLISIIKPKTVVDLGVDYGYSTFVFANSMIVNNINGNVYGVDLFEGDMHTGFRNTYNEVIKKKEKYNLSLLEIIKMDFTDLSKDWYIPIDLLHIDGLHTYNAIKNDFNCWNNKVSENGIILFHDVTSFPDDVGKYFFEIQGWRKLYFTHSAGLGVLTKNNELYEKILRTFSNSIQA